MNTVKPTIYQSRGKDISTIINADKEEKEKEAAVEDVKTEVEELPPVVPKNTDVVPLPVAEAPVEDDTEEIIKPVKKTIRAKKHRKLNSLDISSEDDPDSDEDFKGSRYYNVIMLIIA